MVRSRWGRSSVILLAILALLGTACTKKSEPKPSPTPTESSVIVGSSDAPSEEPSEAPSGPTLGDLAGTWSGTWANQTPDNAVGTFDLEWEQHGNKLVGTISIAGTPCLDGGSVEGTLRDGNSINFGVVQGQVEVLYAGTVKGDEMSGTYATDCGNAEGDWEATRTG